MEPKSTNKSDIYSYKSKFADMMLKIFNFFANWSFNRFAFIIADPCDNSITLSKRLFRHMKILRHDTAKVFVFYIPKDKAYGFILNPHFQEETQLCDIQYNSKYKWVGFETLVPTVNRIFYDYGIKHKKKCKLSINVCELNNGYIYYKICRPHGKFNRK